MKRIAIAILFALLSFGVAQAAPNTVDTTLQPPPPVPPGWTNLFANLKPGSDIVAGTALLNGCAVTDTALADAGWFIRTAVPDEAYGVGDHMRKVIITCAAPVHGLALHGDQDPKHDEGMTTWTFDSTETWTPPVAPDDWRAYVFDATTIEVDFYGDSAALTIYTGADTTEVTPPTALPIVDENGNPIRYLFLANVGK